MPRSLPNRMFARICLLMIFTALSVRAHISLTFPEPRFPPLDFLDNKRTPEPCGIEKPAKGRQTILKAGATFNVTWRLAYPHQGGFLVEILDRFGAQVTTLTPEPWSGSEDQTLNFATVTLPKKLNCTECILRLQRQALEWGDYKFWSCADISVIAERKSSAYPPATMASLNNCFDHGSTDGLQNEKCICQRKFHGDFCQFANDCETDDDCSNAGKCLQREGQNYPLRECYCEPPHFGLHCEKVFRPTVADLDQACFNYYDNDQSGQSHSKRSRFESFNLFNPACYTKIVLNAEEDAVYWRVVENDIEMILQYSSQSWIAVGWRPENISGDCRNLPELFSQNDASPVPPGQPNGSPQFGDGFLHHGALELGRRLNRRQANEASLESPMDCSDMVVGFVKESHYSRIGDYYTRDRSTPLRDEVYSGKESLTAAYGVQFIDPSRNGSIVTIVMFRKPLKANEPTDHSLVGGRLSLIWAKGQTPGAYKHSANSGLDVGQAFIKDFYAMDELLYHGSEHRGQIFVEFKMSNAKADQFRSCSYKNTVSLPILIVLLKLISSFIFMAHFQFHYN